MLAGASSNEAELDRRLAAVLAQAGFTGRIESTLEERLGRRILPELVEVGRLLFFDNINGLHQDNSCAGCHSPAFGFGDAGSIAIGVDSNRIVGAVREGPRNQRKAPMVVNTAFLPKLMLNGRFVALSGDPFDNSSGFLFPAPEGTTRFPPNDPNVKTLLAAQGHIPQTELVEMAGFTGTAGTIGADFDQFDNGQGHALPPADDTGFRNEPIRDAVLALVNATPEYRRRLGRIFNRNQPFDEGEITFAMIGAALGEFQTSLLFADAPIDRFARGQRRAMTEPQKRGALLFFDRAGCVSCHAVGGASNEMFSDFENHVLAVPQIAPMFGAGTGNVVFDGPNRDEDFGAEQVTGDSADRYRFRTSPLRNVALQPAFFHNGAFTRLEDAIRHHLDPVSSALAYNPVSAGVDFDLALRRGPIEPVLERLDPLVAAPLVLSASEFEDLLAFVRDGLLDLRARPDQLCRMIPEKVLSGLPVLRFEGCS
jgi:cytochrome c peroxidase